MTLRERGAPGCTEQVAGPAPRGHVADQTRWLRLAHADRSRRQRSAALWIGRWLGVMLALPLATGWAADGRTPPPGALVSGAVQRAGNEGMQWLSRIQAAAQRLNYIGNFVHQQGSQLQASRITHAWDQTGEHEKLEILDGQPMEYIRHNDELKCYVPGTRVVVIEKRPAGERFPGLVMNPAADVDAYYKFTPVGTERIAGRSCQVTLLEPRDRLRYGYRLWTDQQTGLLLKAQTLNERGEVIEQVGFTQIDIGAPLDKSAFRPKVRSLEGWRTERLETRPVDLAQAGWVVRNPPAGFQKIRAVKRLFADGREVSQMVFSDGLANISVFIEAGSSAGNPEGETQRGPIHIVTRRQGEHWLTVVGEAPAASIRQLANSLELSKSTPK